MPKAIEKTYACIEHGEHFTIEATSLDEAREDASMWGAQVIRVLTKKESETGEYTI